MRLGPCQTGRARTSPSPAPPTFSGVPAQPSQEELGARPAGEARGPSDHHCTPATLSLPLQSPGAHPPGIAGLCVAHGGTQHSPDCWLVAGQPADDQNWQPVWHSRPAQQGLGKYIKCASPRAWEPFHAPCSTSQAAQQRFLQERVAQNLVACWFWPEGQPLLRPGSCVSVHCSRWTPASGNRGSKSTTPAASASRPQRPPPAARRKPCSRHWRHRSSPQCTSWLRTRRCCPASSPLARGWRRRPEVSRGAARGGARALPACAPCMHAVLRCILMPSKKVPH